MRAKSLACLLKIWSVETEDAIYVCSQSESATARRGVITNPATDGLISVGREGQMITPRLRPSPDRTHARVSRSIAPTLRGE